MFSDQTVAQLRQRSDVEYVEKNVTLEIGGQTLPWGIDRTDADVAHANGGTGGDNSD